VCKKNRSNTNSFHRVSTQIPTITFLKKKVKNATSLRVDWRKYYCSNPNGSSFNNNNNNNTIKK